MSAEILPPTSREFRIAFVVLAIAKALLLFVILPQFLRISPSEYNVAVFPDQYDSIAKNLVLGNGYKLYAETSETMLRTPGFVLYLAGIFWLVGKNLLVIQIINLLVSTATGWGVYRLALHARLPDRVAILAAAIFMLYPATVLAESRGGVESLFTGCAVLVLLLVYRALASYAWRDFLVLGVVFGLALLIKSTLALVLPALFFFVLARRAPRPDFVRLVVLFTITSVATLAMLAPWVIRNYRISGEIVPTMTLGPLVAFQSLYVLQHRDEPKEHWVLLNDAVEQQTVIANEMGLKVRAGFFPQFYTVRDEVDYYAEVGRRVRAELASSPALAARFVASNFVGFWVQGRTERATLFNAILVVPFLALAIAGVILGLRRGYRVGPLIIVIVAFVAPHLPILGVSRYHTPLVPFLAIFGAIALATVGPRWLTAAKGET